MNDTTVTGYLNGKLSVSFSTEAPRQQQQVIPYNPKTGARLPTEGLKNLLATCFTAFSQTWRNIKRWRGYKLEIRVFLWKSCPGCFPLILKSFSKTCWRICDVSPVVYTTLRTDTMYLKNCLQARDWIQWPLEGKLKEKLCSSWE